MIANGLRASKWQYRRFAAEECTHTIDRGEVLLRNADEFCWTSDESGTAVEG